MSRDRPETARQRLERLLSAIGVPVSALPFKEAIGEVIAEERERCAKIVRNWKCDPLLDNEGNMGDLADAMLEGVQQ